MSLEEVRPRIVALIESRPLLDRLRFHKVVDVLHGLLGRVSRRQGARRIVDFLKVGRVESALRHGRAWRIRDALEGARPP